MDTIERNDDETKLNTVSIPSEDDIANEALFHLLTVMRAPINQRDQLVAIKTALEFCKAKPAAKKDVTLHNAEAFLSALAGDDVDPEAK